MSKITFLGAGSTVFAKNVLGDCLLTPALQGFEIALFDIDHERLQDSAKMLNNIKKTSGSTSVVNVYTDRKEALSGAKYVVNAIQVGGYDPCTITDFEIPKKYGLRQTIADTVGIGGIFRNLRTIPVMLDFATDVREVCPDALFLNYTNPMLF
jgi:alpha-galactosidase